MENIFQDKDSYSEDLRHAAQRIRWAGRRAQPGPWHAVENDLGVGGWAVALQPTQTLTTGVKTAAECASEQNARWIAKVSPHISVPLAELLEEAAAWLDIWEDPEQLVSPIVKHALPLAWAILRTPQPW